MLLLGKALAPALDPKCSCYSNDDKHQTANSSLCVLLFSFSESRAYALELKTEAMCRLIILDMKRIGDRALSLTRLLALGSEATDPFECELRKVPALDRTLSDSLSRESAIVQRNRVPILSEDPLLGGVEIVLQKERKEDRETRVSGFKIDSYVSPQRVVAASKALGAEGM